MISLLSPVLLIAAAAATPTSEMRFTGALAQLDRGGDRRQVKQFDLSCLVSTLDDGTRETVYIVTENGGAAIAWPERFGRITTRFDPAQQSGGPIPLLYVHQERPHVLALPGPIFEHRAQLAEEAEWSTESSRYSVVRAHDVDGRRCWEVQVAPIGRGGAVTLVVDPQTGAVVSGSRRLTMGQGDVFELTWRLDSERELGSDEAERTRTAAESLLALQTALGRGGDGAQRALSPDQLETAAAAIPEIREQSHDTPFARLTAVIGRDIQAQQQRAASVAELSQRFVGRPAPEFALVGLDGKPIQAEAHRGKTLVLHFWEYRDEPLEEPYGQVGYLDFLLNRHPSGKLAVYGVAVDRRFRDPATVAQAVRSARKLKSFMNLGYEITADRDGKLLKAFGDPTQFDAALPLWVIIGPDGTVAHYKTGFYEVDREVGLAELDAVVTRLEQ